MPAPNPTGPVDYGSLAITTVSNVTLLFVTNSALIFQWIGYASILVGFLYNLVKFVDWLRRAKFFTGFKKLFSKFKNKSNVKHDNDYPDRDADPID